MKRCAKEIRERRKKKELTPEKDFEKEVCYSLGVMAAK